MEVHMAAPSQTRRLSILAAICVIATLGLVIALNARWGWDAEPRWLLWAVLVAGVELLPVATWRGLTLSVGFPLLMMIAILYPPGAAGAIAFLGASDPRELRGEVSVATALFNRSQVALSVMAAGAVFHIFQQPLAPLSETSVLILVIAAALAAVADYVVNAGLVATFMSLKLRMPFQKTVRQLTIGGGREFLVSYLGLGVLGLTLAAMWEQVGPWMLPAVLAPLIFARQVFYRSRALEEAHVELQEREEILRVLSNTMAEERADERLQIAGYLHDDLAQVLFRLSLQVDIARKMLDKQDLEDLRDQLEKIKDSKQETSDRIRALIRELHRSPLGATGLAESLESFTDEVGRDSGIRFHHDVAEMDLPAPTALLIFKIACEGVMNAMKHADPSDVWIGVTEADENIVLKLRDNGSGFDTSAPGPEGHFGMAMMRERAKVGGGTLDVASSPDDGTTITVRFPTSLLQRDQDGGTGPASANTQAHASLGTPGTTTPSAEGSRGAVPA
ncbi:MAG TPA: sensor histidine kinase [Actinomycetota bacterium]|nr:sensor histidine kinase [Actinomycetota bacterium]